MRAHTLHVGSVHLLEVRHVGQENVDVQYVVQIGARGLEHHPKGFQDLPGLIRNGRARGLTRGRINTSRAAYPNLLCRSFAT